MWTDPRERRVSLHNRLVVSVKYFAVVIFGNRRSFVTAAKK